MSKVAVVLSGCGVNDGSEIHEATLTLLYLDQAKAEIHSFAPDKNQADVVNHVKGEGTSETRNVMVESARISRGEIRPLSELKVDEFDAVVFPGGFGAAKNLCTFAANGPDCSIDPEVQRVIVEANEKRKVIGAICIAPVVVARALKDSGVKPKLTIGTDQATSEALAKLNAQPVKAQVHEAVVDEANRIVSTPAYMLGPRISDVASGIQKFVGEVIRLSGK
jgi:enhancing lycopene biosynthesis protein 2